MDDKDLDRTMDEILDIPIPKGLAERLEQQIDALAAQEKRHKSRRFIYWASSAAAVMLLCVGIFFGTSTLPHQSKLADTYTDPAEAAIAAEKALAFMSTQLNKGFDQVSDAGQEIEKVNQIVNKHLLKD